MIVNQDDGINARRVLRFPLRRLLLVVLTLAVGHALMQRFGLAPCWCC
jgi:hypothetical protein